MQPIVKLPGQIHLDATNTLIRPQDLEYVMREILRVDYPALKGRSLVPPVREQPPIGATKFKFRTYDYVGLAKILTGYANDIPMVEVSASEDEVPLHFIANGFYWSMLESWEAQYAGVPLTAERGIAARDVIEETLDALIAVGSSVNGFTGALNNGNVPQASVATVSGDTTWADKFDADPELIIDDINDMVNDVASTTNGIEELTDIRLPIAQYRLLKTARLQDQNCSLLDYVQRVHPGITFGEWHRLSGAGSGGTDRMWGFTKNPRKFGYLIPMEFTPMAPQEDGMNWRVHCLAKSGGVTYFKPFSASYRDGI